MKILILCDSHGANYGCKSYSMFLKEYYMGKSEVEIITYAGISLLKIVESLEVFGDYDKIIIQIGNPDISPRMPYKFLQRMKKITNNFIRDSLFSIPPKLGFMYFCRLPLFILRLIVIRMMAKKNYYSTDEEFKKRYKKIYNILREHSNEVFIIQLFQCNEKIYGNFHNKRALKLNEWLKNEFGLKTFIDLEDYEVSYKNYFNYDYFHLKTNYHEYLSKIIIDHFER